MISRLKSKQLRRIADLIDEDYKKYRIWIGKELAKIVKNQQTLDF